MRLHAHWTGTSPFYACLYQPCTMAPLSSKPILIHCISLGAMTACSLLGASQLKAQGDLSLRLHKHCNARPRVRAHLPAAVAIGPGPDTRPLGSLLLSAAQITSLANAFCFWGASGSVRTTITLIVGHT